MANEPRTRKKQRKRSPKQCAAELAIEKRRESACQLRLAGWSIRDIAGHLKCSVGTVHDDISTVLERTRDSAANAIEKQKRLSLARLDRAVKGIWPAVETGAVDAARVLVQLEQRRAKIEGFDSADKHEIAGPGGGTIAFDARLALETKLNELRDRIMGKGGKPGGDPGAGPVAPSTAPVEPSGG
jgi:hypothetical protein